MATFNKIYSVQVWLSSVVLGPILFVLIYFIQRIETPEVIVGLIGFGVMAAGLGAIFFLPTFLLHHFLLDKLRQLRLPPILIKIILTFVGIGGTFLTLFFIGLQEFSSYYLYTLYAISITISGLLHKLHE